MFKKVFDAILGLFIICATIFGLALLFHREDVNNYIFSPSKHYVITVVEAHQKEQATGRTLYLRTKCKQVRYDVGNDPRWWTIAEYAVEKEYMKPSGSLESVVIDLKLNNYEYDGKDLHKDNIIYIPITNTKK